MANTLCADRTSDSQQTKFFDEADLPTLPTQEMMGLAVHALRMEDVVQLLDHRIQTRRPMMIAVVNAAKITKMRYDRLLDDSVRKADLVLADGMSVVWASRLLRRSLPERVAGIDLVARLLQLADRRRYRVYLLGAKDAVLNRVVERIESELPGVVIAGAQNGYFSEEEEEGIARRIRESKPDMLFVGMTSPKKERFLGRWAAELNVPVCHGVGGSFDVWAGLVQRAPAKWQNLGLEWLYRVLQEPGRLWKRYLVTNTLFLTLVLREMLPIHGGRKDAASKQS